MTYKDELRPGIGIRCAGQGRSFAPWGRRFATGCFNTVCRNHGGRWDNMKSEHAIRKTNHLLVLSIPRQFSANIWVQQTERNHQRVIRKDSPAPCIMIATFSQIPNRICTGRLNFPVPTSRRGWGNSNSFLGVWPKLWIMAAAAFLLNETNLGWRS